MDWCQGHNVLPKNVSDEVLLVYLSEKSKSMKPTTLWSKFSMIKSGLKLKENVDVSKFNKSLAFLKRQSVGYQPTKAKVFTEDEIQRFMVNAPDNEWLLSKVILTLGIYGACRNHDLINLKVEDITDNGSFLSCFSTMAKHTLNAVLP